MYRTLGLLVMGFLVTGSTAQDKKTDEKVRPSQKVLVDESRTGRVATPREVEIHFLNGSTVRLVVQSEALEIDTPYGKLAVPIRDIRAIEFGLHLPEGFAAKIERAVKQLASAQFREREKAGKALIDLGPFSYPAVSQAARDKDLETSTRAKEIVKKLQALHPKKDLKTSGDDKVVTPTFTIVGRIVTPSIKVREEYFGEAVLNVAKMRTLRAVAVRFKETSVSVDASKYGNAGQWLETSFPIDGRTALVITAKGLVDLAPQNGGQQVGPAGMARGRVGKGGFGGGGGIGGGGFPGGAAIPPRYGGALFGKIGEHGEPFLIGERYEGTPDGDGKLYLHVAPSPYNSPSSGSYEVLISPKD